MKTQLTEKELNFYNALYQNREKYKSMLSSDYFCNILFRGTPIKDNSYDEIDFTFDLRTKRKFIDDSVLLFSTINCIYVGKLGDWFWMINEYENIYFISKSMIDITNCLLSENCGLRIHENIDEFYDTNQIQLNNGNFKDYLDEYRLFAKQYGYDFDLMKDIDDYEGIEEDIEEFNKLLASYGIKNEDE